jgi:hypothetical protein
MGKCRLSRDIKEKVKQKMKYGFMVQTHVEEIV